jgi:hypothetical protein
MSNPSGDCRDRSSWINDDGDIVHPNAPRGWGGPGRFRYGNCLGRDQEFFPPVSHHQAAEARYRILSDADKEKLRTMWQRANPPPVTVAQTLTINGVRVNILADTTTNSTGVIDFTEAGARTNLKMAPMTMPKAYLSGPANDPSSWTVKKLLDPLPVITFTIQTVYDPGAKAEDKSAYGRGTTWEDGWNGDITLGFHESCHRADHLEFLRTHAPPVFGGKVGMTEAQYKQAWTNFGAACTAYHKKMDEYTEAHTDEVGEPTKSEYVARKRTTP